MKEQTEVMNRFVIHSRSNTVRAQVTLFVIIAVVMVIVIILLYVFSSRAVTPSYDPQVSVARQNVLDCLDLEFRYTLTVLGLKGGYDTVPEPSITIPGYLSSNAYPYYYHEGDVSYPTSEELESNVANGAVGAASYCFSQVADILPEGVTVSFSEPSVAVTIDTGAVTLKTEALMTVLYDETSVTLDLAESPIIIDSELYGMHALATYLATYYVENNEWTPYSELLSRAAQHGVYVSVAESPDGSMNLVEITSVNAEHVPQSFVFRNKFSHEGLEEVSPLLV